MNAGMLGQSKSADSAGVQYDEEFRRVKADYIHQIEVEDGLMHSRLQWTLTVQGFLFASFGLSTLQQSNHPSAKYFADSAPILGAVPSREWLELKVA
jgi:hypothetical protein